MKILINLPRLPYPFVYTGQYRMVKGGDWYLSESGHPVMCGDFTRRVKRIIIKKATSKKWYERHKLNLLHEAAEHMRLRESLKAKNK